MTSKPRMPLILRLASRNLFQDRPRFIGNIVGIAVSIVLVTVQMGLLLGFSRMITTMIQHASAELWIVPQAANSFENAGLLDEYQRFRALSVSGVTEVVPVVTGFSQWRLPSGANTPVFIVGSGAGTAGLQPWNLMEGSLRALSVPGAVAVDRSYANRLGTTSYGADVEIGGQRGRILAVTHGIRSFTTTPYLFTTLNRARGYAGIPDGKASFLLLRVAPTADLETVKTKLRARLSDVDVLTPAEFSRRSRAFWLFSTGAGAALLAGALLASLAGTVIVAQTLYASTKDHLDEFATLRAIGASGSYLRMVIALQAVISAVIGFLVALAISTGVAAMTADAALPVVMTPSLTAGLFVLTVLMCVVSGFSSIIKVMRVDPVTVLAQ
jgi:putative ABC transport system permease protein